VKPVRLKLLLQPIILHLLEKTTSKRIFAWPYAAGKPAIKTWDYSMQLSHLRHDISVQLSGDLG
jgi:hypothetical protein